MMTGDALSLALETGKALAQPELIDGLLPFVVRRDDYVVDSLEALQKSPTRIKQKIEVYDAKSFIEYFNTYAQGGSRVFVDAQTPHIIGILDYHADAANPEWTEHQVRYMFRRTREWNTWMGKNVKPMTHVEFAHFIEDNVDDIIEPAGAEMLEIARTFDAKKSVNFSSGVRTQNGEIQFKYEEKIEGSAKGSTMEMPDTLTLSIAPFEGSPNYKVKARLRYKLSEQGLTLWYKLVTPEKITDDAVKTEVATITADVTLPVTYGSPVLR